MEDILITKDKKGGTAILTTWSPLSHYGIPVLRIEAEDVDGDFGPADVVENALAADVIFWLLRHPGRGKTKVCLSGSRQPPPQDEITPLIEVLRGHKGEILNDPYCFLIEQTLEEIAREYYPGTLPWMKANRPDEWGKILTLEQRVNEMASRGDLDGLRGASNGYRGILTMVKEFKALKEKKGQGMFNYGNQSRGERCLKPC